MIYYVTSNRTVRDYDNNTREKRAEKTWCVGLNFVFSRNTVNNVSVFPTARFLFFLKIHHHPPLVGKIVSLRGGFFSNITPRGMSSPEGKRHHFAFLQHDPGRGKAPKSCAHNKHIGYSPAPSPALVKPALDNIYEQQLVLSCANQHD